MARKVPSTNKEGPGKPGPSLRGLAASVDGEAVEAAGAADAGQRRDGAARRVMRRVPGGVVAAIAVHMADHGVDVVVAVGGPVTAGMVVGTGDGTAEGIGAGQHVMLVRLVAAAGNAHAFLVQRRTLVDVVAVARDVAMQVGDVHRDDFALGIVPGAIADAVARVHGARAGGAHIGMPGTV